MTRKRLSLSCSSGSAGTCTDSHLKSRQRRSNGNSRRLGCKPSIVVESALAGFQPSLRANAYLGSRRSRAYKTCA